MRFKRTVFVLIGALFLGSCSETPRAKELRLLAKGQKELAKKNYAVAQIHFKNAAAAQPQDAEPYYQLGLAYLASNEGMAAFSYLFKAAHLNPKHTGAQLKLADLLTTNGAGKEQFEDAKKRAQDVLVQLPEDADALHVLGVAEMKLGNLESADQFLVRALRKSPSQLKSSVALAHLRVARKDIAGAEAALKEAAAHAPKSPDPWVYLGDFYLSLNKPIEAEQQFLQALGADPKHARALLALANLQLRTGHADQADQTYRRIAALPEKQYRSAHAQYLFQSGKKAEAVAELEKLHSADQADRTLRTELVRFYLALNRVADAEKVLTSALKKNGRDTEALLLRSRIYLASKKYVEAQNDLNQVLHSQSQSAEAHYLLAQVYQGLGDADTRKQELGEALRVNAKYMPARVELAQALIAGQAAQAALNLLEETPAEQRDADPIQVQRNLALLALGQKAEARKGIDHVLSGGQVPEALLQDAALKLDQKDYTGGRAAAEKVLARNPDDVRALKLLVQSYSAAKQTPAGLQKIRDYAQARPGSAPVQQYLGDLLLASGDRPGARKAFESARSANPDLFSIDIQLAEMDFEDGRRDESRRRLESVLATHPTSVPGRLLLAEVDQKDGKSALAEAQYRKVLELQGKNLFALNQLAYLLANGKQADEALKYAQMARQLAPENATVDDTLGWTYYQKGMYTLAVSHLESATTREANAVRKYHLAMAYLKAGDPIRGRQQLEGALKINANLPEAQEARQLFATAKN